MRVKVPLGAKSKYSFSLVKWDGEAPENWKEIANPQEHPKCLEVIEWKLGQPNTVTYRRNEN